MISEAELRQKASVWGVDSMVVDLDYSLGWFISAFYTANERASRLCFKGGTCLRKCYFGDYRFSEDLDFTATIRVDPDQLLPWTANASEWSKEHDGPSFEAGASRIETTEDEYGRETYQVRIYYRGPLHWGGSPRAIRLDVTRAGVTVSEVTPLLAEKFAARGVDPAGLNVQRLMDRRDDFREDWERRLSYLVQGENGVDFGTAWDTMIDVLRQIEVQKPS